jgi:hypothetical protein
VRMDGPQITKLLQRARQKVVDISVAQRPLYLFVLQPCVLEFWILLDLMSIEARNRQRFWRSLMSHVVEHKHLHPTRPYVGAGYINDFGDAALMYEETQLFGEMLFPNLGEFLAGETEDADFACGEIAALIVKELSRQWECLR